LERKSDDRAIAAFFAELAEQPWLGHRRRRWPRFFFHVTDVRYAASILAQARLLCRARASSEQQMTAGNASPDVLDQTPSWVFDYVRLYFRPRTPTFYRNEGIRPPTYRQMGAHCPVPVAFMFDSKDVAGRAGVRFSDGNLAGTSAMHGEDARFLYSLDFRDIYHDGPMGLEDRSRLRSRRQAEIIVPGELGLEALVHVATRSPAERQTLLTLLEKERGSSAVAPETIIVDSGLFFCEWTYIESVTLVGGAIRCLFNPDSQTPGPFTAVFEWSDSAGDTSTRTTHSLRALGNVTVPVPEVFQGHAVRLSIWLDDALAFSGTLEPLPSGTMLLPRR
jgi:hypothetical protein